MTLLLTILLWALAGTPAGNSAFGKSTGLQPGEIGIHTVGFSPGSESDPAGSAEQKLEFLKKNAAVPHPVERATVFNEQELNAYLASGKVKLPAGLRSVHFAGKPGIISGKAEVDFDAMTGGKRSSNPLLSLFSGVHQVEATAHAAGHGGEAQINVDAITLDGLAIPSMAVEFFIERYLKSKHPEAGLNPTFKLPERIDSAIVGEHTLTVIQK
jgi:hypothetical protein